MTRVKICGTTTQEDLRVIEEAGADAFGVIVTDLETPRGVSPATARSLVAAASPLITSVLVCTPEQPVDAVELVDAIGPDRVQIHGHHPPAAIQEAVEALECPVVAVTDPAGLGAYRDVEVGPAAVLVDSLTAERGGGTGEQADPPRVPAAMEGVDRPRITPRGLRPPPVAALARPLHPHDVDAPSGVEAAPGRKDPRAVRSFIAAARGAI